MEQKPPKAAQRFFKLYCKKNRYEELEGDLQELFYDNLEHYGPNKAKWLYVWDVLRCFQPYAWKNTQNNSTIIMFNNYYKTSYRSLMKNPLSSFINLFGLSMAIGICVLVYGFGKWYKTIDQHHTNKKVVFLSTFVANRDGADQKFGMAPAPLGEAIQSDFDQIKRVCRLEDKSVVVKFEDNVFHEQVRLVDPSFLDMFTFPLVIGNPGSLRDPNSIILSQEMAIKYFGHENPMGEEVLIKFDEKEGKAFKVTGVVEKFPDASAIEFDCLINFENIKLARPELNLNDWAQFIKATLIEVNDPKEVLAIKEGMDKYMDFQNKADKDWAISAFDFESIETLYENAGQIRNHITYGGYESNHKSTIILSIIACFMLALACFNYINIAIVTAAKRLKEIAVRKAIGANKQLVVVQFLTENMLVTSIALLIGFLLGSQVFIPGFEQLNHFKMGFNILDPNLFLFLGAVLLFTGLASGLYPAFYISRFHIVSIFKGQIRFGKNNMITKVILGFQLVLSCITIVCAVMFTLNSNYLINRSWGYQPNGALYIKVHNQHAYEQMKAAMSSNPNVGSIAGSVQHIGKNHGNAIVKKGTKVYEVNEIKANAAYKEVLDLKLMEGRFFIENSTADRNSIVVNRKFVENTKVGNPIGAVYKIDSMDYQIVGVVEDFHMYSFFSNIEPTIFRLAQDHEVLHLSLKVTGGKEMEVYRNLQTQWATLYPEIPFQGGHQDGVWGNYFEEIGNHAVFWNVIAMIAVVLAGLGLYGLITLNVSGRVKEFSIRKLLGAKSSNLANNIVRQYVVLFVLALGVGGPLSYFLIDFFFNSVYTYHVPMSLYSVLFAVLLLVVVLVATVLSQVRKTNKSNVVEGLRTE